MKKPLALFFLFISMSLMAQEANILFNRMNMGVYNPAFTGSNGSYIAVNSRNQWSSIQDAPRTNYLIYQSRERKNVFLGFTAQNDRVFIENKTHFTIDYNYKLTLNTNQFLYLGLKGGGFYNNIDIDRLQRLYTNYNPALAPVKSYFTPVLGVGVQWQGPNYFLGVGIPSLFDNKRFQDNAGWETIATDVVYTYFSGGFSFDINERLSLSPVMVYRAIPNNPNLLMTTLAFNYNEQFSLGAGFSNNENLAFFVSSKSLKGIEWGYGYEFMNRNDATAIQGGTHEFTLRFMFKKKEEVSEEKKTVNEKN